MAEGILRRLIKRQGLGDRVEVRSAGTWGAAGDPASANAVRAARERGVDISGHKASQLDGNMIRESDLILTMEPSHLEEVLTEVPEADGAAHVITTYADPEGGDAGGVEDPYGGDRSFYSRTCHELEELLQMAMPRLLAGIDAAAKSSGRKGG